MTPVDSDRRAVPYTQRHNSLLFLLRASNSTNICNNLWPPQPGQIFKTGQFNFHNLFFKTQTHDQPIHADKVLVIG
jgi:hypothetical protein